MADGDIWISGVLKESRLVVGTDVDAEEPAWQSIFRKEYPDEEGLPARLYAHEKDETFEKRLPELFTGGGGIKISSHLAAIFRRFNLGSGEVCPARLYLHDRITPENHDVFLLFLWEQRQFLDVESSIGLLGYPVTRRQPNPPPPDAWGMPWEPKSGDIAVAPRGLDGLDFWYDPNLRGALFFSDLLRQALRDAGHAELFKFRKCRILTAH